MAKSEWLKVLYESFHVDMAHSSANMLLDMLCKHGRTSKFTLSLSHLPCIVEPCPKQFLFGDNVGFACTLKPG